MRRLPEIARIRTAGEACLALTVISVFTVNAG
jgi:hypothetical protein